MNTKQCKTVTFKSISGITLTKISDGINLPFKNGWIIIANDGNKERLFIGDFEKCSAQELMSFPSENINIFLTTTDEDHLLFIKRNELVGNLTLQFIKGRWGLINHKTDSLQWTSIYFNKKDQTYWVAAERKLYHFDKIFKTIKIYSQNNGLPDLEISSLISDNQSNIWFHSDRKIYQLDIKSGEISTLTEKDGFKNQDFELLKFNFKDENGDIYFSGGGFGRGFDRIRPNLYINPPSLIYLQSFEINQKPFPLKTGINNFSEIVLRYYENNISIGTGIIDYFSKGKSHMRYWLEGSGLNGTWQYGPSNYTIRFQDLRPGKYKLRMQASNASLQFIGPEKTLFILITPPWWATWWAWILYSISCLGILIYVINLNQKRIIAREKAIADLKELEQAKEIEKAYHELKTTQAQLIQSEKMASLGELTAGIAHEIQNPLNFVNNFSEINREIIADLKMEIKEGHPLEALAMVQDLEQNEEKINYHGKRAGSIVQGMLEHSRRSYEQKELMALNTLADEYLKLSYRSMLAKDPNFHVELIIQLDPKLPLIFVTAKDIGWVFLNLFNNAFYAVKQKQRESNSDYKPEVSVSTGTQNGKIIIKIRDNGVGIPNKIKDKIMQPFFTTKPTGEGTGLGLSLVYDRVVNRHGGSINVETEFGFYTEIIIGLPLN